VDTDLIQPKKSMPKGSNRIFMSHLAKSTEETSFKKRADLKYKEVKNLL
jgi:hypothetical protein